MPKYSFDEKKHAHTLDGKPLHGVTTVLSSWGKPDALVNWAVGTAVDYIENYTPKTGEESLLSVDFEKLFEEARTAHLKKRDKAGDKGTEVHAELEKYLLKWIENGTPNWLDEGHSKPVADVLNWMQSEKITPLASEMNVWSEEWWVGGIIDGVVEKEGKKYILDFKTSGTVQTKYFYQLGAYAKMYEDSQNEKIHGAIIVHIPRGNSFNPEKNVYYRYDVEELKQAFASILYAYKLDQSLQKLITY